MDMQDLSRKAEKAVTDWQTENPEFVKDHTKMTAKDKELAIAQLTEAIWGNFLK